MIARATVVTIVAIAGTARAEPRVALRFPTPLYATDEAARGATPDPVKAGGVFEIASAALVEHDGTVAKLRLTANKNDCLTAYSSVFDITVFVPEAVLVPRLETAQTWTDAATESAWCAAAGAPLVRTGTTWQVADAMMTAVQPPAVTLSGAIGVTVSALPADLRKGVRAPRCPAETKAQCEQRQRTCMQTADDLDARCIPYSCQAIPDHCAIPAGAAWNVGAASTKIDRATELELGLRGATQIADYRPNACMAARGTLSVPAVYRETNGGGALAGMKASAPVAKPARVALAKGTRLYWPDGRAAGTVATAWEMRASELTPGEKGRRCFTERWLDTPLCF